MKTIARVAVLGVTLSMVAGCSNGLRRSDRSLREPVRLPSAPALDSSATTPMSPTAPSTPNMISDAPSPLSATAPSRTPSSR
jgi:hypothetical protein